MTHAGRARRLFHVPLYGAILRVFIGRMELESEDMRLTT